MRSFFTPRWIAAHLVVIIIAVVFINLGFWQLQRGQERELENSIGESRLSAQPVDFDDLMVGAGSDLDSLQYRRTTVSGVFAPEDEVLIRSQVFRDTAGFHVITPLLLEDGTAVLVNRGWVPLVLDTVPVTEAMPAEGRITIEGWVNLSQHRGALGPVDPEQGRLTAMNRVDIDRIEQQLDYDVAPIYLVKIGKATESLPVPASLPTFDDPGPHLGYAIQWFGFTIVGLVGYWFLLRRSGSALPMALSGSAVEPSTTPEKQDTPGSDGGAQ